MQKPHGDVTKMILIFDGGDACRFHLLQHHFISCVTEYGQRHHVICRILLRLMPDDTAAQRKAGRRAERLILHESEAISMRFDKDADFRQRCHCDFSFALSARMKPPGAFAGPQEA